MDNGWIGIADHPIAVGEGLVIVWHVRQGVMVMSREEANSNPFISHWMEINAGAWIDAADRAPTRTDADEYDCVISLNKCGLASMAGWHRFGHETELIQWQPPPPPPVNFRELRYKT